jgi:hypothetical protein
MQNTVCSSSTLQPLTTAAQLLLHAVALLVPLRLLILVSLALAAAAAQCFDASDLHAAEVLPAQMDAAKRVSKLIVRDVLDLLGLEPAVMAEATAQG